MTREEAKEKVPAWLSHLIPLQPEKQIKWCRYHIDEIYDGIGKCRDCTYSSEVKKAVNGYEWIRCSALCGLIKFANGYCDEFEKDKK